MKFLIEIIHVALMLLHLLESMREIILSRSTGERAESLQAGKVVEEYRS